jgi:hypothetical protein
MVCIPELILNNKYYTEIDKQCSHGVGPSCVEYLNKTQGNSTWLYSMSYDHIWWYKSNLREKLANETAEKMVFDLSMLNCLAMIVIFVLNLIGISNVSTLVLEVDFLQTTPADFTLMISNLPTNINKEELREVFNYVRCILTFRTSTGYMILILLTRSSDM